MDTDMALTQDLCARLCHDLVGPLGTVIGAIDMLGEDAEAAELAREAAAEMRRRLKFWRAACGGGTGTMAVSELAGLLEGMLAGGRARLALEGLPLEEELPAALAQLLLVSAMLAGEALPRGGTVRLARVGKGMDLLPEGRSVAWPPCLVEALAGASAGAPVGAPIEVGAAGGGPRAVLAAMLPRLALSAGWRVALALEAAVPALRLRTG